jgi:(E)-4-hydroxy-3-methylbut-2-enyl-diphosphate synthase
LKNEDIVSHLVGLVEKRAAEIEAEKAAAEKQLETAAE